MRFFKPKVLSAKKALLWLAVTTSRFGWLPANISPLGSYGFFGNPVGFFLSIIIFDQFVGGRYAGFIWTYVGFAAYPLLGLLAKRMQKHETKAQLILLPVASFLFFLISNFGVWISGWYPATLEGLLTCYLAGLSFYVRTLVGDLVFGYGYLAVTHRVQIGKQVRALRLLPARFQFP